jgi:hypothetical protein
MRAALPLLAACAALAACANQPRQVNATPPSVSYQVPHNNVAATNAEAQNYCAQYGRAAQYQGVEAAATGTVAVYTCDGTPISGTVGAIPSGGSGSSVPPDPYAAPAPPLAARCAGALHQDRPGGSDYRGPPVTGCPR